MSSRRCGLYQKEAALEKRNIWRSGCPCRLGRGGGLTCERSFPSSTRREDQRSFPSPTRREGGEKTYSATNATLLAKIQRGTLALGTVFTPRRPPRGVNTVPLTFPVLVLRKSPRLRQTPRDSTVFSQTLCFFLAANFAPPSSSRTF